MLKTKIIGFVVALAISPFLFVNGAIALPRTVSTTPEDNVIQGDSNSVQIVETSHAATVQQKKVSGTSLQASTYITPDQLSAYLNSFNSPLASESAFLLQSPYWSTIIGICSIEQYNCSRAPFNNYWGLMKPGGGLQHFATLRDGISAIEYFLDTRYAAGRTTLQSFDGYYCVNTAYPGNICPGWRANVTAVKTKLENIT